MTFEFFKCMKAYIFYVHFVESTFLKIKIIDLLNSDFEFLAYDPAKRTTLKWEHFDSNEKVSTS